MALALELMLQWKTAAQCRKETAQESVQSTSVSQFLALSARLVLKCGTAEIVKDLQSRSSASQPKLVTVKAEIVKDLQSISKASQSELVKILAETETITLRIRSSVQSTSVAQMQLFR